MTISWKVDLYMGYKNGQQSFKIWSMLLALEDMGFKLSKRIYLSPQLPAFYEDIAALHSQPICIQKKIWSQLCCTHHWHCNWSHSKIWWAQLLDKWGPVSASPLLSISSFESIDADLCSASLSLKQTWPIVRNLAVEPTFLPRQPQYSSLDCLNFKVGCVWLYDLYLALAYAVERESVSELETALEHEVEVRIQFKSVHGRAVCHRHMLFIFVLIYKNIGTNLAWKSSVLRIALATLLRGVVRMSLACIATNPSMKALGSAAKPSSSFLRLAFSVAAPMSPLIFACSCRSV